MILVINLSFTKHYNLNNTQYNNTDAVTTLLMFPQVTYLKIRRSHYIAARRAHLLEQAQREPHGEEHFEKEIAKVSEDFQLTFYSVTRVSLSRLCACEV